MAKRVVKSDGFCTVCEKKADDACFPCFSCECMWHIVDCTGNDDLVTKSLLENQLKPWKTKGSYKSICFICPPCRDSKNLQRDVITSNRMAVVEEQVSSMRDDLQVIKDKLVGGHPTTEFPSLPPAGSYASKVKASDSVIVIKKSETQPAVSRGIIQDAAQSSRVGVSSSYENQQGDTVLIVEGDAAKDRLAANLREKVTHDIVTPSARMPTIRVTGMDNKHTTEDVFSLVKNQNQDKGINIDQTNFKVLFIRAHAKDPLKFQATVRVSNEVRASIDRAGNKLHVGLTVCPIYDHFHVKRCNRCQGYHHYQENKSTKVKCTKDPVCADCAGPHETDACQRDQSDPLKCVHCAANDYPETNHKTSDPKCKSYVNAQKKLEQSIGFYKKKLGDPHQVKCLLWNPKSLQNKVPDFTQMLEDNDIDISFVCETWMTCANNLTSGLLKESGYSMYHDFRKEKLGGGVAIIARSVFVPKNGKTFRYKTFEVFVQNMKLFKQVQPVTLVILYRLGEESKPLFIEEFFNFLEFLTTNYHNLIICGDFNIHINKPTDTFVSNFNDILDIFSLKQCINVPTHLCGNTLDLIIYDPTVLTVSNIDVHNPQLSDHSPIFFNLESNIQTDLKREVTFRNYKNVNLENFKKDIDVASNSFIQNCDENNFTHSLNIFNQLMSEVVNSHAPLITKLVDVIPKPGWIDAEYRSARSERRKLYKIWKNCKTKTERKQHRQRFEISRRAVNDLSIIKRKEFYAQLILDSKNSQHDLHKICNTLLDTQKCKSLPDFENPNELANHFNSFFLHKITTIRKELNCINCTNIDINKFVDVGRPPCAQSTLSSFSPVTAEELNKIVRSRKVKTSAADAIPAQLQNNCLDEIIPAFTKLVNISLSTADINGLKDSVVNPLLKKQGLDAEILSNYRPVANIPYLSKLIEDAVSVQIKHHMDCNKIHIPYQSGYKTNHSCESLLLRLTDDILKNMDCKKCTILLLLDLSAAFDTVDHDRLMSILFNEIGLRGDALHWFESYLFNRRQAVRINGKLSDFLDTLYGVPQGSVLGPMLFNIYVRSLIHTLNKAGFSAHGYADDHQVSKVFSVEFQFESIRVAVPRCLDIIAHWMKTSFLKLNSSKSQVIIFAPKQLASQIHIDEIKLRDGCSIPVSTLVKNLGFNFDSELTFSPQINSICSQSYRLLKNLASVRKFLSSGDLRLLVQSIIISRIDNCNSLLYGVLALNIGKLQKLQNSCARLIYGKKRRDHVTPLLHELHWLPVRQRIVFKILLMVFKYYQNLVPIYISDILHKRERDELVLEVPRASTRYGDRAFSICAPRLWNALPRNIRASETIGYFRAHLKHHLFSNFDTFINHANIFID